MITMQQLNKRQEDYIKKLDVNGLKTYIDNIAKSYYLNIINKDKLSANNSIETLNKIKMLHQDKNLDTYINHSLITVFNDIFQSDRVENLNRFLPEPSMQTSANGYLRKTELDDIMEYNHYQEALKIESEFQKKCKSKDDLLKLYHYTDYI